jgi:hypothetical protein
MPKTLCPNPGPNLLLLKLTEVLWRILVILSGRGDVRCAGRVFHVLIQGLGCWG